MSSPLVCPITYQTFVDPVLAMDGRTYERSAIEAWFAEGHRTSPLTNAPIATTLITNYAIRDEIERVAAATATAAAATASTASIDAPLSITATYDSAAKVLHARFSVDRQVSKGTDIILVLDTSGSMSNVLPSPTGSEKFEISRMTIAKHSARVIAALCGEEDRLSLITFSAVASVVMPMTTMDATGKARVDAVLRVVEADGQTNLWDALRVAASVANASPGRRVAAILMTDGEPTTGTPSRGLLETLPILAPKDPWVLHTLGFSDAVDSRLLTNIASWGHGSFGFIPSGDMVGTVCINTVAHCLSIAHRGSSFSYGNASVATGPLLAGQPRDFLLPCASKPAFLTQDGHDIPVRDGVLGAFERARYDFLNTLRTLLTQSPATMEAGLRAFVARHAAVADPRVQLLLRDIVSTKENEGQVLLATRYMGSWGPHYLLCYMKAQELQHCVNFKDVGLQDYGGPDFARIVTEGDKTFALMPPMEMPKARVAAAGAGAATAPLSAPYNYSAFHNSSGGCFAGHCEVKLDGASLSLNRTSAPIQTLRRGDYVYTPEGPAMILYAVKICTSSRSQPMSQIGKLTLTPWHPILTRDGWKFPADLYGYSSRLIDTVYNLVLDRGHIVVVEGVQCVTLAHGFHQAGVAHDFFGTHAVIDSFVSQPGYDEGRPVFRDLVAKKNYAGVVCGWEDAVAAAAEKKGDE